MANYTYFVSSGQVQNVVRLESQTMFVASGGTAGRITVSDKSTLGVDGLAMQITVLDGGTLNVFRGKASPVTVSSGGRVFISSGGETSGTSIKTGGTMYIINGKSIAKQSTKAKTLELCFILFLLFGLLGERLSIYTANADNFHISEILE